MNSVQDTIEYSDLKLPRITFRDEPKNTFLYVGTRDELGQRNDRVSEYGDLVYFKHSLQGKPESVLRRIIRELNRHQFDNHSDDKQKIIVGYIYEKFGKKVEWFVRDECRTHDLKIDVIRKHRGDQAAKTYITNEFLSYALSFLEAPTPQPESPCDHFSEEVWKALIEKASEEKIVSGLKVQPQFVPSPLVSRFYDDNEQTFFELQKHDLLIDDEVYERLVELGLSKVRSQSEEIFAELKNNNCFETK